MPRRFSAMSNLLCREAQSGYLSWLPVAHEVQLLYGTRHCSSPIIGIADFLE